MSQKAKLLLKILSGTHDASIQFSELQNLLEMMEFKVRIKGDHFIYTKSDIEEIINIQPKGNKAKPYQVKQIRNIILKYRLGGDLNV